MYVARPDDLYSVYVRPVRTIVPKQRKFWQDVCREMGPRNYNSLASRQLGAWVNTYYDKRLDHKIETPRSPKELNDIRTLQRKAEFESRWSSITGSK